MIKIVYRLIRGFAARTPTYSLVELYDDRLWPWLRCFLAIWFSLLALWGLSFAYEFFYAGTYSVSYFYGAVRFWWFYIPVFGFIMQLRYYNHSGDGFWSAGPSFVYALRSWLCDLRR